MCRRGATGHVVAAAPCRVVVIPLCSASHCCDCRRKSLGGNWKTNVGQSILEEVEVQERYKLWVDQVIVIINTTITTIEFFVTFVASFSYQSFHKQPPSLPQ